MSTVDHPKHYNAGKFEVIDVIEDWKLGFCLGNVVKYIARAEHKNSPIEDLKKARWYLDREIQRRETAQASSSGIVSPVTMHLTAADIIALKPC